MAKRLSTLFLAFSVASSACGTIQGDAPGRAGIREAAPYDAPHLDAGNVDSGSGSASQNASQGEGPQLVP